MFSFNSDREGKFISVGVVDGPLACSKTTKWKTCPIDWISLYAKDFLEAEKSCTTTTADASQSSAFSDSEDSDTPAFVDADLEMVNVERKQQRVPALTRSSELDGLAKWHARRMAKARKIMHSEPSQVSARMDWGTKKLGSNVGRGRYFQKGYDKMMQEATIYCNVVDPLYTEMGMATFQGNDGKIYICQLFRG